MNTNTAPEKPRTCGRESKTWKRWLETCSANGEKEIKEISTPSLQEGSRKQLAATRAKYESLHDALRKAEQSMTPVLTQFKDHVLYLKHNLNAQAIASIKGEATNIQTEITRLLQQMNTSIAQADEFIKAMP